MNEINICQKDLRQKNSKLLKMRISILMFYAFFLLKPLYLSASGSLQIGDMFLVLSFFFLILEKKDIPIKKNDYPLAIFVICVFLINTIYCFYYYFNYQQISFYMSSLYYLFNFFAVICFRVFSEVNGFLEIFSKICAFNILFQAAMLFLNLGTWFGGSRYMGTYNDPNQFAFAIFTTFCILYCVKYKNLFIYFLICLFLIYKSGSTGMLSAMCIIAVCHMLFSNHKIKISKKKFLIIYLLTAITVLFFLVYGKVEIGFSSFRLDEKMNRNNSVIQTFINDRNIDLVIDNPLCFIYGAGEGLFTRFPNNYLEVHSTWIAIAFYYGIVPFIILAVWITKNIKTLPKRYFAIYIALFVEAFSLANQRQPALWMLIVLSGMLAEKNERNIINENKHCCSSL